MSKLEPKFPVKVRTSLHYSHNLSLQPFFHDQMVINTIAINTNRKGKKY
jgi:hypothetical protein